MTKFVVGVPVVTPESSVVVDAGLPVGQHRFRLEVVTDTGQKSPPDEAVVQVQASTAPVGTVQPVLSPTVLSTPTPVLSSPAATPSLVSVASTLPKTVAPSTRSRAAISSLPSKKTVSPSTTSRTAAPNRPRKKTASPSKASRTAIPRRPRKKTVSPSTTRRATIRRRQRKKKE